MAFDTEQQPTPPPPPYAPVPPSFAFGPGASSRRGVSGKAVAAVVAVVVAGAGAFAGYSMLGGADAAPAAVKTKATDPRVLGGVLKNLATAEESYATDHDGRYTTKMNLLQNEGFASEKGVEASVVRAGDINTGYCLQAVGATLALYYDSATGAVSKKACS